MRVFTGRKTYGCNDPELMLELLEKEVLDLGSYLEIDEIRLMTPEETI